MYSLIGFRSSSLHRIGIPDGEICRSRYTLPSVCCYQSHPGQVYGQHHRIELRLGKRGCRTKEYIPEMRQPNTHFRRFLSSFSPLARSEGARLLPRSKKRNFFCVLGISTSAEVDVGRCPLNPCELLKKLDQNFYTCDSPFFCGINCSSWMTALPREETSAVNLSLCMT